MAFRLTRGKLICQVESEGWEVTGGGDSETSAAGRKQQRSDKSDLPTTSRVQIPLPTFRALLN